MKNLKEDYYNPFFSHIYVEKSIRKHVRTQRILEQFPKANVVEIEHYKDVFCRKRQNYTLQHKSQNLILAAKKGNLIYQGAPVCQSFGNEHFYYTSCMMNCVYDCEYCYLKGMYPSGNLVVFVNLEDYFEKIEEILKQHSMYLCISYDTDLLAFESVLGYTSEWISFQEKNPSLQLEIRTKSTGLLHFSCLKPISGIIFAVTLSPQTVIDAYEHGTPSFDMRLSCVAEAQKKGFAMRLCFDPMIYCKDWEMQYAEMINQVFLKIDMAHIKDVSIGTFRVSREYLKKMQKDNPNSAIVQFPYENIGGVCQYSRELSDQMENFLFMRLKEKVNEAQIFLWEKENEE